MSAQAAVVVAERYAPPLRIGRRRQTIWAVGLIAFAAVPIVAVAAPGDYGDWPAFWVAGRLVGTLDLADIGRQAAWQEANGLAAAYFPYPPPIALLFAPFAAVSLGLSFWLWAAVMAVVAVLAGWTLAPVYRLRRSDAVLAVLAWAPVTASLAMGQNGPLGLLLAAFAITALVRDDDRMLGVATGLLLYKPMWGLPLVLLLVLRSRWRAIGVVAVVVAAGYLLGILATGGDAAWPEQWLRGVNAYAGPDRDGNALKVISLPLLLERAGAPAWLALAAGAAVVAAAIPSLRRAAPAEAAAAVCLVGLAASPHALPYDAALAAPFLLWMLGGGIVEPWRTRLVAGAYLLGPLLFFSFATVAVSPVVVVLGAAALGAALFLWVLGGRMAERSRRRLVGAAYVLCALSSFALATAIASPAVVVLGGVVLWLSRRWRSDAPVPQVTATASVTK